MILLIDNYDSFTYNLYQTLAQVTDTVQVVRNDCVSLDEIEQLAPDGIVLSPGPGRPEDAGICVDIVRRFSGRIPILGVCLGHQAIATAFGGQVVLADRTVHGKNAFIFHTRQGLYAKMPLPFAGGRYHSLIVDRDSLPETLEIDAENNLGLVMGLRHREHPTFGLQFHPESILTPDGPRILRQFIHVTTEVSPC